MKKRWKWLLTAFAVGAAGVNGVAWMQAGAMTTWADAGDKTKQPEELGWVDKAGVLISGVSIPRPTNRSTPRDQGLDFETLRFPNGVGDELEAWHLPVESADVVSVLFHGHAGQKDSMLGVAKALTALGSRVLLVDFYGSGGSSGTGTTIGVREAHDVRAAVDFCRERWPDHRVLLYGQSMGGSAILRAVAALGAEPDGIVVEATFDRMLSTVASRFHRMGLPATPFAHLLMVWGSVRIGANAFAHNPAEYARSVRCPILVLQGDSDRNISVAQASSIRDAATGWSRSSTYTKTGHEDLRTADTELWTADLRSILEQL